MRKQVMRDYIMAFHIRNLKEVYQNYGWWIFLYIPVMTGIGFWNEETSHIFAEFVVMLPIMFALFQAPLFRIRLPKIMFLCPIDAEGRRGYLKKQYWLKITVPVSISLLALTSAMLLDGMSSFTAGCTLAETVMFTLGTSIGNGLYGNRSLADRRAGIDTPKKYETLSVCETLELIIGLLFMYALMALAGDGESISSLEVWKRMLILFPMLFIQFPITLKTMTYLKPALADAMDYETENRI